MNPYSRNFPDDASAIGVIALEKPERRAANVDAG